MDAQPKRMAKLFELGGISFDENESLSGIPMTRWSDDEEEVVEEDRGGGQGRRQIVMNNNNNNNNLRLY